MRRRRERVGGEAGEDRADDRPDQQRADERLLLELGGVQRLVDVEQRAGDDAGVVAEQEAAERSDTRRAAGRSDCCLRRPHAGSSSVAVATPRQRPLTDERHHYDKRWFTTRRTPVATPQVEIRSNSCSDVAAAARSTRRRPSALRRAPSRTRCTRRSSSSAAAPSRPPARPAGLRGRSPGTRSARASVSVRSGAGAARCRVLER